MKLLKHGDKEIVSTESVEEEPGDTEESKNYVKKEIERIRGFVSELSLEELKSGDWFAKLLSFSLKQYTTQVDAEYFKQKYPNLPADAIVDARIKMAANYAAIEGALSSAAYSGAVAATIGSGGAASPLALPAGGASFVVDLSYTSYLQLRLAHDIAVLYRVPLNLNDPDDTWKLVKLAFGIKVSEAASASVTKGLPVVIRPIIKKIFSGSTLTAVKSLPVVGKYLLQRNIIKFAMPGVTIPVTTAVNRWTTQITGNKAKDMLRREAQIIEASKRIVSQVENVDALLWVLWWIVNSENTVLDEERLLLHYITVFAKEKAEDKDHYAQYVQAFREQIEVDQDELWERVAAVTEAEAQMFYRAAIIAAAVDGKISKREAELLDQLAARLELAPDEKLRETIQKQWN
ncbi:TerB family tellurite resistance protein [Leucobacter sp. OH2974_COT-288]|nr:TerB family tellurite resistance protein [Leucobacter sp. OH2974_COT-288]